MGYSNFKFNGVQVKNPSDFNIERYNVTTLTRVASAKMVGELVAKKRKFLFTYNAITASDLQVILDAIWETNSLFFPLEYMENNVTKVAVVYAGAILSQLHNAAVSDWVWKNLEFDLIEQ